jgi:UDP-N-acetylmuramate dehydrogenase
MDVHVARKAASEGLRGLEFLVGVPGTIGGAIAMNAGAYGGEIQDIFLHARAVDHLGHVHELDKSDFDFSYRKGGLAKDMILLDASFKGTHGDAAEAKAQMQEIMGTRQDSQPIGTRTGGSTFKNPGGMKAWELIDKARCRGLQVGDAQVSEKHCNFLINHGGATAFDIELLGEKVRSAVQEKTGVKLDWEVRRIGRFLDGQNLEEAIK